MHERWALLNVAMETLRYHACGGAALWRKQCCSKDSTVESTPDAAQIFVHCIDKAKGKDADLQTWLDNDDTSTVQKKIKLMLLCNGDAFRPFIEDYSEGD